MPAREPPKKHTLTTIIPDELMDYFKNMCRRNQWTQAEVVEWLLEYACKQDESLVYEIHKSRLRKSRSHYWTPPNKD